MKKLAKKSQGFTLIELVIVIVIIAILAVIAVPIYRNYVLRGYAAEGRALLGSVAAAERAYAAEHGKSTATESEVGVDPSQNKYFTTFDVSGGTGKGFTITTKGVGEASGIGITFFQPDAAQPVVTENLGS